MGMTKEERRSQLRHLAQRFLPLPVVISTLAEVLFTWNRLAINSGRAPDHIKPIVRLISVTEQLVPVSYQ